MAGPYRLVVVQDGDEAVIAAEAAAGVHWQQLYRWSVPCAATATPRRRRQLLEESATDRGWALPAGRWPRAHRDGRLLLTADPTGWTRVLTDATAVRREVISEFIAAERAWRGLVSDAVNVGGIGAVGAGSATDLSRWRIYQIIREPMSDDESRIIETVAYHDRQRSKQSAATAAASDATVNQPDGPTADAPSQTATPSTASRSTLTPSDAAEPNQTQGDQAVHVPVRTARRRSPAATAAPSQDPTALEDTSTTKRSAPKAGARVAAQPTTTKPLKTTSKRPVATKRGAAHG